MRKSVISLLSLIVLVSCSKSKNVDSSSSYDGEIRITSNLEATRASYTEWEKGDEIGVFMGLTDGTIGSLGENVLYSNINVSGSSATFTSDNPLLFPKLNNVDLLAYYPYDEGTESTSYTVDVSDQSDITLIDLMSATKSDVAPSSDAVEMQFAHRLSNILITIKAGVGLTDADLASLNVTLSGTIAEASYDLTTDEITLGTSSSNITLTTASDGLSAEGIAIPQTLSNVSLIFSTKSYGNFEADIYTASFESGMQYSYTATINCTETSLSSGSITAWSDAGNEDITADPSGSTSSDSNSDPDLDLDSDPSPNLDLNGQIEIDYDFDYDYDLELVGGVYQINSANGLVAFSDLVNGSYNSSGATTSGSGFATFGSINSSICGQLMTNIELTGTWSPIGSSSSPFIGVFDGDGKVIGGLTINSSGDNYQALFGYVGDGNSTDVEIKGVTLLNPAIYGDEYVGGLVGYLKMANVSSCAVSGGVISGSYRVGGIVGYSYLNSVVTKCYNTGEISGGSRTGGIVGDVKSELSTISSCYNTGAVSGTSSTVGGVAGGAYSSASVVSCYNTGDVTVSGVTTSGGNVTGYSDADVTQCYYISSSTLDEGYGAERVSDVAALNVKVASMTTQSDGEAEFTTYTDDTNRLPSLLGETVYFSN